METEAIEDAALRGIIDAAIGEIGAVRPAPDFLPRLRAHVEDAPRGRPAALWIQAGAAAIAIALVAILANRHVSKESSVARPAERPIQIQAATKTPTPQVVPNMPARRRVRHPPLRARSVREPEVLVPVGQRQAVGRLFEALRAGRPEVVSMLLSIHSDGAAVAQPGELMLAPLSIEPVVISTLPEK